MIMLMLIFFHLSQLCPVWVADHADANEFGEMKYTIALLE